MFKSIREKVGQVRRVAAPFWKTTNKRKAGGLLALAILFTFGLVLAQYLMTTWNQQFYDSMQKADAEGFKKVVISFFGISALLMAVTGAQFFFSESLGVRWREGLTRYCMELWMKRGNLYFWNHVPNPGDNPDQRISQDVELFVRGVLTLGVEAFKQLLMFGVFVVMLWQMSEKVSFFGKTIPGSLVWVCMGFALFGTAVSHFIGRKIVPLSFEQQTQEANLRAHLIRTREHAESIVLMKGEKAERKELLANLHRVIGLFSRVIHRRTGLTMFSTTHTTFASALPVIIAAPSFFAQQITLGDIMQILMAFTLVSAALSFFVSYYAQIAEWSATVQRLDGYMSAMKRAEELRLKTDAKIGEGESLAVENLRAAFPHSENKSISVSSELAAGESLMIVGTSGAGKSTLLRVLAGIWPYFEGQVSRPKGKSLLFLPQKPYIPTGTLRQALAYPMSLDSLKNVDIAEVLDYCGLDRLVERLDDDQRWQQILSPGEQQRLNWVRAFIHKPDFLFLDEATSAVDEAMQEKLYSSLQERIPGVTVVSVAHRSELKEYHDSCLDMSPEVDPMAKVG